MITKTLLLFLLICVIKLEAKDDEIEYIPATIYYKFGDYSKEEINCLHKGKFFVNGECLTLLNKGPCGSNEWLVLEKTNPRDKKRPKCSKKPCRRKDEVWWPKRNRCEKITNIKDCKGQHVIVNPYGEGDCGCNKLYGEFEDRSGCHKYYQRGPCAEDEVVTHEVSEEYAVCTKDICLTENTANKSKISSGKKYFAPILGHGKCVRLGDKDICNFVSNESIYLIDEFEHIPTCSQRIEDWYFYKFPFMYRKDINRDYNCAHWFDQAINKRNCTCNQEKLLGCALPAFVYNGIDAKTFCIQQNSNCRPVITADTSRPVLFLNNLDKVTNRRNNGAKMK